MMKPIAIKNVWTILAVLLLLAAANSRAEVRIAQIFGDHMVLQRDAEVPIWGWAEPGETITVTAGKSSSSARADATGKWMVSVGPFAGGDSFSVTVKGSTTLTLQDVVAGDVWICSGQSNMEWALGSVRDAAEECARADFPMIRHVKVRNTISLSPLTDVPNSGWQVCSPETAGAFTGVGYFFGRRLHRELDVPIGLLNTSWGGTIVETWTSAEALGALPGLDEQLAELEAARSRPDEVRRGYDRELAVWQQAYDQALNSDQEQWHTRDLDLDGWQVMELPERWEQQGLPNLDGLVWFRTIVDIPSTWAGKDLTVSMSPIDDSDTTWVNGVRVGGTDGWNLPRTYPVPGSLVQAGPLTLAVRVLDTGGGGGFHGDAELMSLECPGEAPLSIAGSWNYRVSEAMLEVPPRPTPPPFSGGPNHITLLYNAMIHPLIPYAIRGAIWYQGESNAGAARQYRDLFPAMIKDWRTRWGADFPFYFVQLANFMNPPETPGESAWAELREAQRMALALPRTGMAVAIDIGEALDIHPRNKQDVGRRLADNALAQEHGRSLEYSGPSYTSMQVEGRSIRLRFDHLGGGLQARGGPLKQFAIAGADRRFTWANATIDGDTVVVESPEIENPVAVRYAWADNPEGCNLYNQANLPASPFRTDDWPGVTGGP